MNTFINAQTNRPSALLNFRFEMKKSPLLIALDRGLFRQIPGRSPGTASALHPAQGSEGFNYGDTHGVCVGFLSGCLDLQKQVEIWPEYASGF